MFVQREFVLIKLKKKDEKNSYKGDQGHPMVSNVENQTIFDVQEQATDVQNHAYSDVKEQTTFDFQNHVTPNVQNQTTSDAQNQATTYVLNQATTNVINQPIQDNYHQDTCGFGEQSCHTSSTFQAHNLGASMINSADNPSEVSHYMAYSDHLKQFPNELIPNSGSYSVASDSDNQNLTKLVAMSTIESCSMASDFENQKSTIPSMETPPDSSGLMASISPYQSPPCKDYPDGPMASISSISQYQSPDYKVYSSDPIASISQYRDKEADMSASGEGQWGMPMALSSDIGIQNPDTVSDMSIFDQRNWHFGIQNAHTKPNMSILEQGNRHSSMAYFPESDVPEGEAMFPEVSLEGLEEFAGDDMDLLPNIEIQTPYDNNEVSCPRDSGFVNQSPYNDGESSGLKATDTENRNKDKNADVSASQESEKSSLVAAPSDFERQNACMSDLLVAGGICWSPLMASLSENGAQGEIVLTEEQSQLLAEWEAEWEALLELRNSLNST